MPYNLFKNQSPSQSLFSNVGASCLNVDSRSWQPIRLHSNLSYICLQTCQSFILYCSVMKIFIDKLIPPPLHSYFKVNRGTDEKGRVGKYQIQKIPYLAITTYQQIFCLIIYIIINYHVQKVRVNTCSTILASEDVAALVCLGFCTQVCMAFACINLLSH